MREVIKELGYFSALFGFQTLLVKINLKQGFPTFSQISYHLGVPYYQCVPLLPEQLI